MLVLGVYGSPRKQGNTDHMLDAFLEGAVEAGADVRRVYVRDLDLHGCMACGYCDRKGVCVQKDSMVDVYPLFDEAQRIVVASPMYFYGVTGQLKLLIDRSQAVFMRRELMKKEGKSHAHSDSGRKGFLLCAGATKGKRMFECAILCVRYFFDALSTQYAGELCYQGVEECGAIKNHPTALEECRQAGFQFASTP